MKEYLLVSQDEPLIEQFVRNGEGGWKYNAVEGLEGSLALPSIECAPSLSAVYDKVDFNS